MNVAADLHVCSLWRYDTVREKLYRSECGTYYTYGIRISTPEYTRILHDISIGKDIVKRIVALLNEYQVSPIHLRDVIIDLLP